MEPAGLGCAGGPPHRSGRGGLPLPAGLHQQFPVRHPGGVGARSGESAPAGSGHGGGVQCPGSGFRHTPESAAADRSGGDRLSAAASGAPARAHPPSRDRTRRLAGLLARGHRSPAGRRGGGAAAPAGPRSGPQPAQPDGDGRRSGACPAAPARAASRGGLSQSGQWRFTRARRAERGERRQPRPVGGTARTAAARIPEGPGGRRRGGGSGGRLQGTDRRGVLCLRRGLQRDSRAAQPAGGAGGGGGVLAGDPVVPR